MAKKAYFVRTKNGEKGPYTLAQIKASIRTRSLSADTEYRSEGEDAWQPLARLEGRIERAAAERRASRGDAASPEIDAAIAAAEHVTASRRTQPFAFVALVLLGIGYFAWTRATRTEALGKPCTVPADCPEPAACLLLTDADRNIQAKGYCTVSCRDPGDCGNGMACRSAAEVGPQGAKWDGMFGKQHNVCMK